METVIAALITAVASITVAVIQARSARRQASILRAQSLTVSKDQTSPAQQTQPETAAAAEPTVPKPSSTRAPAPGRFSGAWWVVGGLIAVEAFIVNWIIGPYYASVMNILILIPLTTCLLSFFRPVFWGYSAAFTSVLHVTAILGYVLVSFRVNVDDLQVMALFSIANAVICATISYLRLKHKMKKLDL